MTLCSRANKIWLCYGHNEAHIFTHILLGELYYKQHELPKMLMSNAWLSFHLPLSPPLTHPVLDVYVLSTDGQVQDFRFPQTSKGGASLQLSSNTVKVNSKNGEKHLFNLLIMVSAFFILCTINESEFFLHLGKHTCLLSHWDLDEKIDIAWGY